MVTKESPIILKYTYKQPLANVWNALVIKEQMLQWYFDNIPDFKLEIGFETVFVIENEGRTFTHQWKVLEVEPLHKIKYNWKYKEYKGDSNVIFELTEKDDMVTLKLTMEILADFPNHLPEFKIESGINGWNYFLDKRLRIFFGNFIKHKTN